MSIFLTILEGILRGFILIIWMWSCSKVFSKVYLLKENSLYIKTHNVYENLSKVHKYQKCFGSEDQVHPSYKSYRKLAYLIKLPGKYNFYIEKSIETAHSTNVIEIYKIDEYKNSLKAVNKFNL